MSKLSIVGGVYREICVDPHWNQIYGSAGRAAIALSSHVKNITLFAYGVEEIINNFRNGVAPPNVEVIANTTSQDIAFKYFHCLSRPYVFPSENAIKVNAPIEVKGEVVLRYGMMEGTAKVIAERCIYDPQSASAPEIFSENGSRANALAVVANAYEINLLTRETDPIKGAHEILSKWGAEVVIVKQGMEGAQVIQKDQQPSHIPPYLTDSVWTIGSGDVFSAMFALTWGIEKRSPAEAADIASRATAAYVNSMALPVPQIADLLKPVMKPAIFKKGKVYLAGPFFDVAQRWIIEEARNILRNMHMDVFSPLHDVGIGEAKEIYPKDIKALKECDIVFALLDGGDPGTLFEVGYAKALDKPVYALAKAVHENDLKMFYDCKIYTDLVTALHHLAWRK